jgi:hypothetical protein
MNMVDPEIRAKWFGVETHRQLAKLAGFELSEDVGSGGTPADLDDHELALLREITSGSPEAEENEEEVTGLLTKLGVGSEIEASSMRSQASMAVRVVTTVVAASALGPARSRPSAFQWRQGDFVKPELLDPNSVDEDVLREVAAACPTRAIVLEEVLESVDSSHI